MARRAKLKRMLPPLGLLSALLLVAVAVGGCGGDTSAAGAGLEADLVEPPSACVRKWNGEDASLTFGRHTYNVHTSRQARVTEEPVSADAVNIREEGTCAVIFAVPESDYEFGDVGLVQTKFGWASMLEISRRDPEHLAELQRAATLAPNVNLFPDGTISPT